MAAGKTTLGLILARMLAVDFVDSDQAVLKLTGATAAALASNKGVPELHRLERLVLSQSLARSQRCVIAAAASVVDDVEVRSQLRAHACIWVEADSATLSSRRPALAHRRTLTASEAESLNAIRRQLSGEFTFARIDTSIEPVETTASVVMDIISQHLRAVEER